MAKGKPRDVTAASVILRQAETPEPVNEPVRLEIRRADPDDQERESAIQVHTTYNDKPAYRPATSGDRKLINTGDIPEAYAEMYDEAPDQWAQFFG